VGTLTGQIYSRTCFIVMFPSLTVSRVSALNLQMTHSISITKRPTLSSAPVSTPYKTLSQLRKLVMARHYRSTFVVMYSVLLS